MPTEVGAPRSDAPSLGAGSESIPVEVELLMPALHRSSDYDNDNERFPTVCSRCIELGTNQLMATVPVAGNLKHAFA